VTLKDHQTYGRRGTIGERERDDQGTMRKAIFLFAVVVDVVDLE
jgi:hypothetical protein